MNALAAIDAALALVTLATRAAEAAAKINAALIRARDEGRDLTPEELAAARVEREGAYAAWQALGPKG